MELSSNRNPVFSFALNCLDYAIRASGSDLKSRGNFVNGHVVTTANTNFSITINTLHQGARLNFKAVAVTRILWVTVRDRCW